MEDRTIVLTPEGMKKLKAELDHLRAERRPDVVQRLQAAREQSEAWDNPDLIEAKNELAFLDGKIMELESMLGKATVLEPTKTKGVVGIGSRVTLRSDEDDEDEVYTIVSSVEAQPKEGKISNESPVGKALIGHRVGERIQVETPAGTRELVVTQIE
jgi:transcription elongation factor GreA